MKVSELMKELRKLPKDAEIYLCRDWEQTDEEGHQTDLYRLEAVIDQLIIEDMGLEFRDTHEVILEFEYERAHARIINDD